MKINQTKMYQAGGYIAYQPNPIIPQQPTQAQVSDTKEPAAQEDTYLEKGILEKMLGQGITSDVIKYSDQVQDAYRQYNSMNDMQRNSYKGRQLRSLLKGDLGQLNALMRSKTMFDDAINNAKSNDALAEYAVTSTGMIVKDKTGGVREVSFKEYADGKGKEFMALTNSQLAKEREYNNQLVNNPTVFSILNYGKGISKVQQEVLSFAASLGSTKKSSSNGSYSTDETDMQELIKAAKNGVFKVKSGESSEDNIEQLKAAKQTMWQNLSENSRAVLRARAASTTNDASKVDSIAQTMAASLLDPRTSITVSKTYDESVKGPSGKGGKGGSGSEKLTDHGMFGMAFGGNTDTIPISQIGPSGVKIQGYASAIPMDAYTGKDGQRVPLSNANLGNISYISKAFVANGDKVDPNLTVITGDAYVSRELPYTQDENGKYKIDYEGAKRYAIFNEALSKLPDTPNRATREAELRKEYGVDRMNLTKFIVAEAVSWEDEFHFFSDRDKDFYEKVSGEEKNTVGDIIDPKHDKVHHIMNNDAHKHLIFIPAKSEAAWNAMDKNYAKIPEGAYDLRNGYNSGANGNNIAQGESLSHITPSVQQAQYTIDGLNK